MHTFYFFNHLNSVSVFYLDLQTIEGINFALVRMYRFSWIIFTLELVLSYTDTFLVFRMGTNCAHLVADSLLFYYKKNLMTSVSDDNQANIIEAFTSTSRYLDDLLNIDNPYFEGMVNQIYPPEQKLNEANTSDTEAPFLELHLSISDGDVSSKSCDKCDVIFPFLDGDVPHRPSYGVYISLLLRFARVCRRADDVYARNECLTAKLLK